MWSVFRWHIPKMRKTVSFCLRCLSNVWKWRYIINRDWSKTDWFLSSRTSTSCNNYTVDQNYYARQVQFWHKLFGQMTNPTYFSPHIVSSTIWRHSQEHFGILLCSMHNIDQGAGGGRRFEEDNKRNILAKYKTWIRAHALFTIIFARIVDTDARQNAIYLLYLNPCLKFTLNLR